MELGLIAVEQEVVACIGRRSVREGRRERFLSILAGKPHSVHAAALGRALREYHSFRQSSLQPVSRYKPRGVVLYADSLFREQQAPVVKDAFLQHHILLRMGKVKTVADDGYRLSSRVKTADMGGGVASKSQTADHDIAPFRIFLPKLIGFGVPLFVGGTRPDYGNGLLLIEKVGISKAMYHGRSLSPDGDKPGRIPFVLA